MKYLIFSDSHGSYENMKDALFMHRDADGVFFLGDGLREADLLHTEYPDKIFISVRGNCDFYPYFNGFEAQKTETLNLSGFRITATHGDIFGVKYALGGLFKLAQDTCSDIILFGHTHSPLCESASLKGKNVTFFNPGSIACGSFGLLILNGKAEFLHSKITGY